MCRHFMIGEALVSEKKCVEIWENLSDVTVAKFRQTAKNDKQFN